MAAPSTTTAATAPVATAATATISTAAKLGTVIFLGSGHIDLQWAILEVV